MPPSPSCSAPTPLVDGLLALTLAFGDNRRGGGDRGLVLHGVLGIRAGIVLFIWPVITVVVLLVVVPAWSVVIGVLQITAAVQRPEIANEWFLALGGAVSVLSGI